jgi:hypothetical protein
MTQSDPCLSPRLVTGYLNIPAWPWIRLLSLQHPHHFFQKPGHSAWDTLMRPHASLVCLPGLWVDSYSWVVSATLTSQRSTPPPTVNSTVGNAAQASARAVASQQLLLLLLLLPGINKPPCSLIHTTMESQTYRLILMRPKNHAHRKHPPAVPSDIETWDCVNVVCPATSKTCPCKCHACCISRQPAQSSMLRSRCR